MYFVYVKDETYQNLMEPERRHKMIGVFSHILIDISSHLRYIKRYKAKYDKIEKILTYGIPKRAGSEAAKFTLPYMYM